MIRQRLEQLQQQRLSYHQILLMKMLLDSKLEFEDRLNQELEENPALETSEDQEETNESGNESETENVIQEPEYTEAVKEKEEIIDIRDFYEDEVTYKTYSNNTSADDEEYERPVIAGNTFQQQLKDQIAFSAGDDKKKRIVNFIIDCLDETGYLRISLSELSDDLAFTEKIYVEENELDEYLSAIQECDPPGIGARNIKECLLLQLKRKKHTSPALEMAAKVISESFDELTLKNYRKIVSKHGITKEDLEEVLSLIKHLTPYPVFSNTSSADTAGYIIPDFILSSGEDSISVTLNTRNEPELKINKKYLEQLESIHGQKRSSIPHHQKETFKFIRSKIESARAFVDAVKLRQKTLLRVVNAIIKKQPEFFKEGDIKKLKPMVLKDIAAATGMEISTISRITSSKYMQTPFGNYLLKDFFSEGLMKDDGDEASNKEIKQIISEVISSEEKSQPLTDIDLSKALKEKGYNVARRTVTKYRKFMRIPSSKMRKDWK